MSICQLSRPDNILVCSIRTSIANIFHNISGKQIHILLHDSYVITQILQFDLTDIFSIQIDCS